MVDRNAESGHELVLDNWKLIIAFAVLIAICGTFFVFGFIAGKRQGYQEGAQTAAESIHPAAPPDAQAPKPPDADAAAKLVKEEGESQQLNWYKNVNRREGEPEVLPETTTDKTAAEARDTTPAAGAAKEVVKEAIKKPSDTTAVKPKVQTGPVTYSVQVGAFRARLEAENKAKTLRTQGYESRIEAPQSPDGLYLLKIGKFSSRAEAVAMQLRLKKSGFYSFVKTN